MSTRKDNRFYRELSKYDGRKPEPPYDAPVNISQEEYDDLVRRSILWSSIGAYLFAQLQDARDVLYVMAEQSNDGHLLNHVDQYDDALNAYRRTL